MIRPAKLNMSFVADLDKATVRGEYEKGNVAGIFIVVDNRIALEFIKCNIAALKRRGIYEEAVLHAFTIAGTNNLHVSPWILKLLFAKCDPGKLRAAGEPLPGPGPFKVYRGVAGRGRARRSNGHSWTDDLNIACWFACRFNLERPSVYTGELAADAVMAFNDDRQEREFIGQPMARKKLSLSVDEMRKRAGEHGAKRLNEMRKSGEIAKGSAQP